MDPSEPDSTTTSDEPVPLDPVEARILGCLVEKQATTPEVYPLTQNAAVAACNQKTNRDPILDLDPGEVGNALRRLEGKGLTVGSLSARATRWEHRMDAFYGITPRQRAVLGVLLLRGPQTLNEIATRSGRLAQFPDPDDLRDTLDRLMQRTPVLVVRLPHGAGQREDRYMHLLGGPVSIEPFAAGPKTSSSDRSRGSDDLAERVERLEAQVAALQERLDAIAPTTHDSQAPPM